MPFIAGAAADFAGNAIELTGRHRILVMSERAAGALRPDQLDRIEATAEVVPLALPTIELAGGSARCMIADLHLTRR